MQIRKKFLCNLHDNWRKNALLYTFCGIVKRCLLITYGLNVWKSSFHLSQTFIRFTHTYTHIHALIHSQMFTNRLTTNCERIVSHVHIHCIAYTRVGIKHTHSEYIFLYIFTSSAMLIVQMYKCTYVELSVHQTDVNKVAF